MARLSTLEKLDALRRILLIMPLRVFINVMINAYLAWKRSLPIGEFMITAVIRSFLSNFTPRQIAAVTPSGSQLFRFWLKAKARSADKIWLDVDLPKLTEALPNGDYFLHWIRPRKTAKKVMLFMHGGGYNAALARGHLNWAFAHVKEFYETDTPIACAVLEYGLTPEFAYPTQLRQARNALAQIFKSGYGAKDIIIGGDSAGAGLTLSLISHILHPQQSVEPLKIDSPLAGIFLVSPWVTDDTSTQSFKDNNSIDMVQDWLIFHGSANYASEAVKDAEKQAGQGWAWPLHANQQWWADLAKAVRSVYITAGDNECFRDHIILLADKIRAGSRGTVEVQFAVEANQAHDHILVQNMLGSNTTTPVRALNSWIAKVIAE